MSTEGDKKIYAKSMVVNAFEKMYDKETNQVDSTTNRERGMRCTGKATESDTHRCLTITILIPK